MVNMNSKKKKLLAVASSGGHWIQLLRLRPAFNDCDVIFASTSMGSASEVCGYEFHRIINATRRSPWNFFPMFFQLLRLVSKVKPDIIVTTGSAPGLLTLTVGKLFRTKNIWIDSIANVEEMSTSGKKARFVTDLYLTQWEALSTPQGPFFKGSVL